MLDGIDAVEHAAERQARRLRQTVQLVFQNPYGSLNPRKKIGAILEEPLAINTDSPKAERAERARAMMRQGRPAARALTTATRTCSPAASASASPSRAR